MHWKLAMLGFCREKNIEGGGGGGDGGDDDGGVGGGDDDDQYNILAASAFLATTVPDLRTQEGDEAQQLAADSWQ